MLPTPHRGAGGLVLVYPVASVSDSRHRCGMLSCSLPSLTANSFWAEAAVLRLSGEVERLACFSQREDAHPGLLSADHHGVVSHQRGLLPAPRPFTPMHKPY